MARRHLLTREMLAEHYDSSLDEREIARHFTLTRDDLELIAFDHDFRRPAADVVIAGHHITVSARAHDRHQIPAL